MTDLAPDDNERITAVAGGGHPALLVAEPAPGETGPVELTRGT